MTITHRPAHYFDSILQTAGVPPTGKFGCVMLDVERPAFPAQLVAELKPFAHRTENPNRSWVEGFPMVEAEAHVTLLYGLIQSATNLVSQVNELLDDVLSDLEFVTIDHVGVFPSPYQDEPYKCVVAHLVISEALIEANARLRYLPHIDTYPDYKAHVTIGYFDESLPDELVERLNSGLRGFPLYALRLNFGREDD